MATSQPVVCAAAWTRAFRFTGALLAMILVLAGSPALAQPDTTGTADPDTTLIDPFFEEDSLAPETIEADSAAFEEVEPLMDEAMDTMDAAADTLQDMADDAFGDPFEADSMATDDGFMDSDTSFFPEDDGFDEDPFAADADSSMMMPDSMMMGADSMTAPDSMLMGADSMMAPDSMMMGADSMMFDTSSYVDPFAADQPMAMATMATPSIRIGPSPLPDPNRRFRGDNASEGYSQGFRIDRTEVTNTEFASFLTADSAARTMYFDERMYITQTEDGDFLADEGYENYPVVFVDWYGAYAYAQWAGKSLPTEEEWILAVLGNYGDQDLTLWYPWGQADASVIQANLLDVNVIPGPKAVGMHPTSDTPTGIADMAGNVAEWTLTNFVKQRAFGESTEGLRDSPVQPDSVAFGGAPMDSTLRFVIKGGSFMDPPINTQLNRRATLFPHERYQYVGFRCITREGN